MKRDNNIDIAKGIAILFIVVHHGMNEVTGNFFPFRLTVFRDLGLFMIIIGFNNANSFINKSLMRMRDLYDPSFFSRRLKRIVYPFIWIFIVEAVFVYFLISSRNETPGSILVAFFQGGWGPGSYFIPVIIQCFVLFPLIFWLVVRKRMTGIVIVFMINVAIEVLLHLVDIDAGLYRLLCFRYLFAISLGALLAVTPKRNPYIIGAGAVVGFLYILALNTGHAGILAELHWPIHKAPIFLWDLMLIVLILRYFPENSMDRFSRSLRYLGKASYHVFLVQMSYYFIAGVIADHFWGLKISSDQRFLFLNVLICIVGGCLFFYLDGRITASGLFSGKARKA